MFFDWHADCIDEVVDQRFSGIARQRWAGARWGVEGGALGARHGTPPLARRFAVLHS